MEENVGQLKESDRDWNCHVLSKDLEIGWSGDGLLLGIDHLFDMELIGSDVNKDVLRYCEGAKDIGGLAAVGMGIKGLFSTGIKY